MPLVSLEQARTHLQLTGLIADSDVNMDDLTQLVEGASEVVLAHLKGRGEPAWTPETAPRLVAFATLEAVAWFYANRGDVAPASDAGTLNRGIDAVIAPLLVTLRDPTVR